ncbi:ATP phosphoribosyltransferase [Gynuella sunshinyii]|uniref:ATP phosphoribosyltransferase n=1 Tax=Gynuella sunshinyii YC6258 TaxID=1445510 RepID=A0A0C5VQF8_9GAMM|nr:ATP phosphoribosyltransferase [Gynuella sunshinyii]AJQ96501.1 ATP phosphoribosyltransferase [Gynuella sunshinyii YC6258]
MNKPVIIALSKGRILDDTLPLLADVGIEPTEDLEKSRKLIFDTNHDHIKFIKVRATDVPTYVEYGAADMGIAGKDVLMEFGAQEIIEVLDLEIAKCRLMTAGFPDRKEPLSRRLKVATKFVGVTKQYFAQQGRQVDVIKLYGAQELAPIMGLADCIVDIVDTGNTLRANGLEPMAHIADVSSRLVVNRAALKLKQKTLQPIIDQMAEAVKQRKK